MNPLASLLLCLAASISCANSNQLPPGGRPKLLLRLRSLSELYLRVALLRDCTEMSLDTQISN